MISEGNPTVVVMGQGYVGLPVAEASVMCGMSVYGFDVDQLKVEGLNNGVSHVDDVHDRDVQEMRRKGYVATSDAAVVRHADVIVICVPTPLADGGGPDMAYVEAAAYSVGEHVQSGALIILESTSYPGTTDEVVLPALEASSRLKCGKDFFLAFSPERIDPGSTTWTITNTPKLVGGIDQISTDKAVSFYRRFVETVVPLSGTKEAETAKLLENTYRHVNIALVNEMSRFCHDLGIDIWEVIRGASTKPFGFQRFTPGPGVGGHCIPIDPNYLSFQVKKTLGYQFKFVELAQEVNNSMSAYIVERIGDLLNEKKTSINGANIVLLGITYKPNIADQRESPALPIAKLLRHKKANISYHDPLVDTWDFEGGFLESVEDLRVAVRNSDLTVLLQSHDTYDLEMLADEAPLLFDTRGVVMSSSATVHKL